MTNPLLEIQNYGQSIWYDYIRRGLIISGELKRMIDEDGLRGVTSNPSIFEKAIAGSTDYNNTLKALEKQKDMEVKALYESLANNDIQDAADVMSPVYEMTKKRDGYVSLEVSPYLANDTRGTLDEARRLWKVVGRDNVMIKVPGTQAGIPAIKQLISEGINVNVTLLFSQETYEHVAEAYISGLEAFVAGGGDPSGVASVASFFVSRIDTAIDNLANARLKTAKNPSEQAILKSITGKVAIANAKLTYQRYKDICLSERWQSLAAKGAQTQRLLWASTSTKNPNYHDVLYVEELIGRETVNTVPSATFDAFRQHGQPHASLEEHLEEAHDTMDALGKVGISMREVTDKLLNDGVRLFSDAFDKLLSAVEKKREALLGNKLNRHSYKLPDKLDAAVKASLEDWRVNGKGRRLWSRDKTLWTNDDENRWLGWLGITEDQLAHIEHLKDIAEEVKREGFSDALLLGMGGSSLCPEVMRMTFGRMGGFPELHVLDSTDPSQIKTFENKVDLTKTLFIVSSKSGGTLEPNIFKQYFFERVRKTIGAKKAGSRFIAITDPGSKMQQIAQAEGFRHIFFGVPSIGGRYSALSNFGMVPSAIMGIDVERFLDRAEEMVHSCSSCVPPEDNPGVVLGT
ncbi:MAG: bifunctional transaldolase/phosoglucose isomerase, partial [Nitrososphaera sp.]|nr:bifunctional transaldolase/phosoglucose isomerase [Nitrososphaera sp.]